MKPENKILINCRQATSLDELRQEGKISFPNRFALWLHLLYCSFCKRFIKQSSLLAKYTGELSKSHKNFTISDERKEIMKRALEKQ